MMAASIADHVASIGRKQRARHAGTNQPGALAYRVVPLAFRAGLPCSGKVSGRTLRYIPIDCFHGDSTSH